jgi:CheY-like chemotaxis protein
MEFAQSAPAALQRITDAAGVSLILILSDINMPGMSGLELLPKAKAARPDVPVIMITAYGDPDTKRKAMEGGAEALFTKPIDSNACAAPCVSFQEKTIAGLAGFQSAAARDNPGTTFFRISRRFALGSGPIKIPFSANM